MHDADALVFSRPQYAPDWVPPARLQIIPPSIDPLAAKNQPLSATQCRRILLDAGGIQDQITDGEDGLLIRDHADTEAFAHALQRLINHRDLADNLGCAAQRSVMASYLDDRHLIRTIELLESVLSITGPAISDV